MADLNIPDRYWKRNRCMIIGEIAQAHDGSLGMAHAYIDAVAKAGADAVKFQTHIASAESTPAEPFRIKFSRQDATRYEYWKRMEFTEEQWKGLYDHATELGLVFISSPFSLEAIELLKRIGISLWKVASGEVVNPFLLDAMIKTGYPILLSTGLSTFSELDPVVEIIKKAGNPYAIMQCTTSYPCPPEKIGLNVIPLLRDRYNCPIGLSDHSGTIYPGIAARILGIGILEVHVTFSRAMFGPDVPASVTVEELRQLVDGVRYIEQAIANPVDKETATEDMLVLKKVFNRSIVARTDLSAGVALSEELVAFKKPGSGIPAGDWPLVKGKKLKRAVKADQILTADDLMA